MQDKINGDDQEEQVVKVKDDQVQQPQGKVKKKRFQFIGYLTTDSRTCLVKPLKKAL